MEYILGGCLLASIVANTYLVRWCMINARGERKDLEDRLLAMQNTEAFVAVKALEQGDDVTAVSGEGSVSYVDEQRMLELAEDQAKR